VSTEDPEPVSLLQQMYGSHTVLLHKGTPSQPGDYARSLLGQQVRVVLGYTDGEVSGDEYRGLPVITEGQLLGFGQGGDFEILEDDGFVHYCWQMLKIEPR
jgi:hypothetical protein